MQVINQVVNIFGLTSLADNCKQIHSSINITKP